MLLETATAVAGVLPEPKPSAFVNAFNESAIQYRIKFPIGDFSQRDSIESAMRTYIWHAFARKGIEIPFPQRVLHQPAGEDGVSKHHALERIKAQLQGVDFLATLDAKQIEVLAEGARWELYLSGERIVRQGDPGEVLYVIVSGKADVRLEQGGLTTTVTTLEPGKCFGEMSLLTGEPRSATVVAATELSVIAVGKQALLQVVQEDRRLIERIGEVVARRQAVTAAAKAQLSRDAASLSVVTHTRSLVERIQSFFWGTQKRT